MSEQINFHYENDETPSSTEVLEAFADRRKELTEHLDDLKTKPGFKMSGTELIDHRSELKQADAELEAFNEEYYAMGGAELDDAEQAVDDLNFKSTAEERAIVLARRSQARTTFYENFIKAEEVAKFEAEEDEHNESSANPSETADSHRSSTEAAPDTSKDSQKDSEASRSDIIHLENGLTIKVSRVDGKPVIKLIEAKPEAADDSQEIEEFEEANPEDVGEDTAEVDTRSRSQKAFAEAGKMIRSPLRYLPQRLMVARNMLKSAAEDDDSDKEKKKSWRKKGIVIGLGAAAFASAYIASKHGIGFGGSGHHDQVAEVANAKAGNTNVANIGDVSSSTGSNVLEHASTTSSLTVKPGEGWDQVMQDAGIPQDKWESTLAKSGPELSKKGLAYWDKVHNEWRIGGEAWNGSVPKTLGTEDLAKILANSK